jgi:hypothetical protein
MGLEINFKCEGNTVAICCEPHPSGDRSRGVFWTYKFLKPHHRYLTWEMIFFIISQNPSQAKILHDMELTIRG